MPNRKDYGKYRLEIDYEVMNIFIGLHAFDCVRELLVCIKKVRLRYETRYATIALAYVLHAVSQTAFVAKAFIVRIDRGIVELSFG